MSFKPSILRQPLTLCLLVCCVLIAGCKRSEEIRVYEIPRADSGFDSFTIVNAPPDADPTISRMVVGMVLRPDLTWTFKILGEQSVVGAAEDDWTTFFSELKFDEAGQPVFDVPENWTDAGTRQGMFSEIRTLVLDSSTNSKMEISSLMAGQGIAMNVNRWRGQLGLPPIEGEVNLPKLKYDGGELLLFDETGRFKGRGGPMFSGGGPTSPRRGSGGNGNGAQPDRRPTMKFEQPAGWEANETSNIVLGRFKNKSEGGSVEMTFSRLPAVNEWELNAQAWAASIGLKDVTPEDISKNTEELEVAGESAKKIRWSNEENKSALIGVMFKKENMAWFAKLIGDEAAVKESESLFDEAVNSIQIQAVAK